MSKGNLTLDSVYDGIFAIADKFGSYQEAATAFEDSPVAYKYIFSIDYVDADIRNGGIYQLHHNSTWHLILDAIEGAKRFGFTDLAANLKDILFYYHRNGRSKMKKRIPDGYFDDLPEDWGKTLEILEDDYYACFNKLGTDDTRELWQQVIDQHPELFEK